MSNTCVSAVYDLKSSNSSFTIHLALRHKIDTATAERMVWTFASRGGKRQDRKYPDVQSRSQTEERKEPSHCERSTIRYTQHRDTRDTTSDRVGWKATDMKEGDKRERNGVGGLGDETQK